MESAERRKPTNLVAIRGHRGQTLRLEIRSFEDPADALRATLKSIRSAGPVGREPVLPVSADAVRDLLTWPTLELLRVIHERGPMAVSALARELRRGPQDIQRDLSCLERIGIIRRRPKSATNQRVSVPEVLFREIAVTISLERVTRRPVSARKRPLRPIARADPPLTPPRTSS